MRRALATFSAMSLMITAYLLAGGLGTALGASHSQCNRIGSPNCVASTTTTSTNTAPTSTTTTTTTTTETSTTFETDTAYTNVTSTVTTTNVDTQTVTSTAVTTVTLAGTATQYWWNCTYSGFTYSLPNNAGDPWECDD